MHYQYLFRLVIYILIALLWARCRYKNPSSFVVNYFLCVFLTGPFGGSSLGARLSSAGSGALTGIMEENNRPSETDASLHSQGSGTTSGNGSGNGGHYNNHPHGAQKQTLKIHTASGSAAEGVNLLEAMEDVSPKSDGSCLVSSTPVVLDP